ncbi:MAG: SDR family NAD(P)-dependent oxidoreductase, partial [Magnetospirillum sp.]|nr:SDR family NAD(P)-dependent oxidoreductase [Magnetospirillum sp.]
MTDKTPADLAAAMSSLLEQELLAGAGLEPAAAPPAAAQEAAVLSDRLEADVRRLTAEALRLPQEQLDPEENLANFGIDSIAITEVMVKISRAFSIQVAPTTFFEARNLRHLADILRQRHGAAINSRYAQESPPPPAATIAAPAEDDLTPWLARHRARRRQPVGAAPNSATSDGEIPVAVIAMDGRFPQSPDLESLEAHLRAGDDCVTEVPADRWDWRKVWGDPRQGPFTRVKWGGFVAGADMFDASLFTISPHEAELMDPQHRLFMECVWALIDRAGLPHAALDGRKIGLFLGVNLLDYVNLANRAGITDAQRLTGLGHAFCPNRLSFLLNVHGPSEVVDTACSSSAVALHRAVMSIRHEGCDMAIAGGSNLMLSPDQHVLFSQVGMLSSKGRCHTFSAQADGYTRADGVGAVLLKRLDLAERDGDPILGVIRASVAHHGGTTSSLTAPNPAAQARLIVEAHTRAGIDPRSVTMVECHGTGTKLGDPVEIEGLKTAFAQLYAERGLPAPTTPHCGIGSIKSNIGHAETAAGIAGLIKLLLAINSGTQYRTLHASPVNPLIDLAGSPFTILHETQPWRRPVIDGIEAPRRAGLSSFGAGGANVHVVVEEYRAPASQPGPAPRPLVVPVSARSRDGLRHLVAALRGRVNDSDLESLAWTLQTGRTHWPVRMAFVAADAADLARQMDAFLADDSAARQVERRHAAAAITADDPTAIAAGWMAGDTMDWSRLWKGTTPRRLSLPPTPFERKRYWLPMVETPVVPGMALQTEGQDRFRVDLKGDEFFLTDHQLHGKPVLPGVAYLELARAAGITARSLKGVVWVRPMMVDAPTTVEISLDRASGMVEIASRMPGAEKQIHAQMRLEQGAPPTGTAADLAALRAAHPQAYSGERIYAAFDAMGLNYGPAHRAITALWTGSGPSVLARLTLPPCVAETLAAYPLHPSLLDGAFQAAIGMTLAEGGSPAPALPFAVEALDLLGPLEAEMWVHIRPAAKAETAQRVRTLDLDLLGADGGLRMRIGGFATRLQAVADQTAIHTWTPHWRPADSSAGMWSHRHVIRAETAGDLAQRYTRLTQQVLTAVQQAAGSTLVQVTVEDGPDAEALAGVVGLLRSAAQERPSMGGQVLILPADFIDPEARLAEAAGLPPGTKLRWENGQWWQEDWKPVALPAAAAPWRDGQVVLITGGLGGLGRLLAESIHAAAPAAKLVLCGRKKADAAAQAWLDSIGAEYVAADIADAPATQALVDGIRARHGHLDGIVHAAGILDDGLLAAKTPAGLAAVLAPKVAGAVNLDRAIGDADSDFFVLFASIAAVTGSSGQTDYAAANGFLEGFATGREVRRRAGLVQGRTIAVAWPLWAEGGMRLDAQAEAMMTRTTGLVPLPSADGLDVLARALAFDGPRLLVGAGDADKLARRLAPAVPVATPVAAPSRPDVSDKLRHALMAAAARQLKVAVEDLDDDQELTEYGFDSISFTQFANALNDLFDLDLTPTLFFEHPTLAGLTGYLADKHGALLAVKLGVEPTAPAEIHVPAPVVTQPAVSAAPTPSPPDDAVAIIAMAGQFPGASDVETFWANLDQGRDCVGDIPDERWDWRSIWGDPKTEPGKCNVRTGGFMDGIDQFDAGFFGLSAPEARTMDPQQRLLLTQAWRLFENAGIPPKRLSGSDTGVFVGIADTGYGRLASAAGSAVEGYAMTGLAPSLGPNRISFHFNLHGPSVAVETACSSALVAVHRAVEAIRGGTCEAAIAGGVNLLLLPDSFIGFSRAGMLAPDGRSKPFSAAADGYGRGEGIGLVLLKRLSAAQQDGDRILALIRASGENHGGRASSLTAPNPKAQADLLRGVYGRAGFDPRSVGYIEAHGTGTPLGDPIEIEALTHAFADLARQAETRLGPAPTMDCVIGSVKSNIGHLELAAGIAGLIKVVAQMQAGTIAASLHCDTLNPYLKLDGTPFRVARSRQDWPRCLDPQGRPLPRRAGVSSFGFGGANAHVVVEEYLPPPTPAPSPISGPSLLVLSAHSPEALTAQARALRDFVAGGQHDLAAIAFSLQTTRDAMEHRLAFAAASTAEAVLRLDAFLAGHDDPALHQGRVKGGRGAVSVLESDPDIAQAIVGLAAKGRADGLLEVWVKGFAVDWRRLYGAHPPQRVALPPYPLAATRHWIGAPPSAAAMPVLAAAPAKIVAPPPPGEAPVSALHALTDIAARVLEVAPEVLDPDAELGEFGFDSITMTGFAAQVNADLHLSLTPADFFEFATLNRLAAHIAGTATLPAAAKTAPSLAPVAIPAAAADTPVAIVGFSCHFPMARDGDAFWDNLRNGRDCVTRIPAERWDWRALDGDPKTEHGKTNIHWGGFVDGVFEFDPLFFGISPREAKLMDPQQRLIMLHVWKAIEDSGHAPRSLAGRRVGLFVGTSSSGYRDSIGEATGGEGYVATGAVPSVGPNRISYFLDWHGPSEPVETACSSSLVALHRAVQAMRAGDCDMAVVGGVNTMVTPEAHINFAKAGMLAPDGRCKTFSAEADGYGRGEGVGMLVLKFLPDAEADGDPILALVRSSAVNHGGRANSLTAPNTSAQTALVQDALRRAGI